MYATSTYGTALCIRIIPPFVLHLCIVVKCFYVNTTVAGNLSTTLNVIVHVTGGDIQSYSNIREGRISHIVGDK